MRIKYRLQLPHASFWHVNYYAIKKPIKKPLTIKLISGFKLIYFDPLANTLLTRLLIQWHFIGYKRVCYTLMAKSRQGAMSRNKCNLIT